MPAYEVKVTFQKSYTFATIYAADESEAEEKASDMVSEWDGVEDVIDAEAVEI